MPPELRVHGPLWARIGADLVAVAALVSLVAGFWWGGIIVALFALVLLGLTVQRVAQLPGALQVATGTVLLAGAWGATLDWYVTVPHLDLAVHVLANGLLAGILVVALRRCGLLPVPLPRAATIIVTTALGALLAVLWELGEWWGHTWLDDAIGVGYDDTIGDLTAALVGSFVAGLVMAGGRHEG